MKCILCSLISFALGGKKSDYGILNNSIMTTEVGEERPQKTMNEGRCVCIGVFSDENFFFFFGKC